MRLMGLDLSERESGIVVIDGTGGIVHSETSGFDVGKSDPEYYRIQRFCTIRDAVVRAVVDWEVKDIWCEGYAYSKAFGGKGKANSHSSSITGLAELRGAVMCGVWDRRRVTSRVANLKTVRATLLGKGWGGSVTKEALLAECKRLGFEFDNHNVMDAWLVAVFGLCVTIGVLRQG